MRPPAVRPPDHLPGNSTGGSDDDCCEISDDRAGSVWESAGWDTSWDRCLGGINVYQVQVLSM